MSLAKILLLLLALITNVLGVCQKKNAGESDDVVIQCTCFRHSEDLVIDYDEFHNYAMAHTMEIRSCRIVDLQPNIFSKFKKLRTINVTEVDYLILHPNMYLPKTLDYLYLSKIGYLSGWLAPEPNEGLLNTIESLQKLHLENITVAAPPASASSSFYNLQILEVMMIGVRFIGTLPQGALEFNPSSFTEFNAIGCHFGDLQNNSIYINSAGNVIFYGCTFGKVESGAINVSGRQVAFIGNSFQHLEQRSSIMLNADSKLIFSVNVIKTVGDRYTLKIEMAEKASINVNANEFPCFQDEMIRELYTKYSNSNCDATNCFPLQNNYCIHADGSKEFYHFQTNEKFSYLQHNFSQHAVPIVRSHLYI
ncbi:hypothetical protein J437_LFUL016853, partial [Ladona fulva]